MMLICLNKTLQFCPSPHPSPQDVNTAEQVKFFLGQQQDHPILPEILTAAVETTSELNISFVATTLELKRALTLR